ncbi:MAG: N-acetyltransferase [Betaproteobacteria bacterium]|nr:MAG: N-acetyltransferase [Betaproteobacteria bacterium]
MIVNVRKTSEADRQAVVDVIVAAFGDAEGHVIAELVSQLLADPSAQPLVSLVATVNDRVVGYVLYTNVRVEDSMQSVCASILAPLAVHPEYQSSGIGGRLITDGLKLLKETGVELVFVLGHPGYYPKYGFSPAGLKVFEAPYPIAPENSDAWMVQEIRAGILGRISGRVACADALDDPKYWIE